MNIEYETRKKEFIKKLEQLCIKHTRSVVFYELCDLMGYALDIDKTEEKEEAYKRIISKYDKKEQDILASAFANVVLGLESDRGDFLGECFMQLSMGDKSCRGQVFTPYHISHLMGNISLDEENVKKKIEEQGYIIIKDDCCGGVSLLIGAFYALKDLGYNPQTQALFYGNDIDRNCARMTYCQLSILGACGIITVGDALKVEVNEVFYTPMFLLNKYRFCNNLKQDKESNNTSVSNGIEEQLCLSF